MIQIAGLELPDTAIWLNESQYGAPEAERTVCPDGTELIHQSQSASEIDIYIPKIAGGFTYQNLLDLRELAASGIELSISINGHLMQAIFRHTDTALELKPIRAKQSHEPQDSYYGYIRLLEV